MEYKTILCEIKEEIAILTLNRPEKRNALSMEVIQEISQFLGEMEAKRPAKVIIIRGAGPAFCAGHDLSDIYSYDNSELRELFSTCSKMMLKMHGIPQPIIAMVHGIATAAGCQLVASCDLAVAGESAQFATPGPRIGVFCHTPMVPLARSVGRKKALEMLFTARLISAWEAKEIGLVNRVVPDDRLEEETLSLAKEITQYSLETIGLGKKTFYEQWDLTEAQAYNLAVEVISYNCTTPVGREGVLAFLEKRRPIWPY